MRSAGMLSSGSPGSRNTSSASPDLVSPAVTTFRVGTPPSLARRVTSASCSTAWPRVTRSRGPSPWYRILRQSLAASCVSYASRPYTLTSSARDSASRPFSTNTPAVWRSAGVRPSASTPSSRRPAVTSGISGRPAEVPNESLTADAAARATKKPASVPAGVAVSATSTPRTPNPTAQRPTLCSGRTSWGLTVNTTAAASAARTAGKRGACEPLVTASQKGGQCPTAKRADTSATTRARTNAPAASSAIAQRRPTSAASTSTIAQRPSRS